MKYHTLPFNKNLNNHLDTNNRARDRNSYNFDKIARTHTLDIEIYLVGT